MTLGTTRATTDGSSPTEWASVRRVVYALVGLSVAFRLPELLNADAVNSDAAIVGLQARHIQHGEWSPWLWGSAYQTSADATVAALAFAMAGATPRVLMASALGLHLVLTLMVFAMGRRHRDPLAGCLAAMPLVFSPASVHSYALYPPRQASLTLAIASVFALDKGLTAHGRGRLWMFVGGVLLPIAVVADPYASVFVPAVLAFASVGLVERRRANSLDRRDSAAPLAGAVLGSLPLAWLFTRAEAKHGVLGVDVGRLVHNGRLLLDECLPWVLGTKVFRSSGHSLDYRPWSPPFGIAILQYAGALAAIALLVTVAIVVLRTVRAPSPATRFGLAALVLVATTLGGFLVSPMVMDFFSMRYLAALTHGLALGLVCIGSAAPSFSPTRPVAVGITVPLVMASAIGGWVSFSGSVDGPRIVAMGASTDEMALREELIRAGVTAASADYWVSYRLTFLYGENPVVVPRNESEDRYGPYRRRFEGAPVVAMVFDPRRSRETLESFEGPPDGCPECREIARFRTGRLRARVFARAREGAIGP